MHYNPKLPIHLEVLSQVLPDGSEHSVAFASRALSLIYGIYGISKFHKYIYGRHFTLATDHCLLTAILGPKTGVPSLDAARLQRWAMALYSYTIEVRSTKAHANTDGLSRLLLPLSPVECSEQPSVESALAVSQMLALPTSVAQLRRAT